MLEHEERYRMDWSDVKRVCDDPLAKGGICRVSLSRDLVIEAF